MRAPVRKMGNSSGIIIPKLILTQIGIETGDDLDLTLDENPDRAFAGEAAPPLRLGRCGKTHRRGRG